MKATKSNGIRWVVASATLAVLWYLAVGAPLVNSHETVTASAGTPRVGLEQAASSTTAGGAAVRNRAAGQRSPGRASLVQAGAPSLKDLPEIANQPAEEKGASMTADNLLALNAVIEAGRRDAAARDVERQVTAALRGALDQNERLGTLQDVMCAAQVCRAHIVPDLSSDPQGLFRAVSAAITWSGERYYELTLEGRPGLSVYAARDGALLAESSVARQ